MRTPVLWGGGLLLMGTHPALLAWAMPVYREGCVFSAVWSVANATKLLLYGLMLLIGLELSGVLLRGRAPGRWEGRAALAVLGLALLPWWGLLDIQGPAVRLLPFFAGATILVWGWLVLNAGLPSVEAAVRRRGVTHLLEGTFPISDVLCFRLHRQRMGPAAGWLRGIPVLSYVAILVVLLGQQAAIIRQGGRMARVPIRVYDPYQVVRDDGGWWYAETVGYDAGLWRYDPTTQEARSYLRVTDLHAFWMEGGALYFYDGFDAAIRKVDTATRRVLWRQPVARELGPWEVAVRDGVVVALGRQGDLVAFDAASGRQDAERHLDLPSAHLAPLPDGGIAFVTQDPPALRVTTAQLSEDRLIPLPVSLRLVSFASSSQAQRAPVVSGTAVADRQQVLCVATRWGDIFRYDLRQQRWLAPYRRAPGIRAIAIDEASGLLFVYNAVRGYLELLTLDDGTRQAIVLTTGFGNALSVDPEDRVVTLSARGPSSTSLRRAGGLYQLPYGVQEG